MFVELQLRCIYNNNYIRGWSPHQ